MRHELPAGEPGKNESGGKPADSTNVGSKKKFETLQVLRHLFPEAENAANNGTPTEGGTLPDVTCTPAAVYG